MPVILPEKHHAAWLGETEDGNLKALLVPYPADQMRMWEISPRVNSPKDDDPSLCSGNLFPIAPLKGQKAF
jgi:putative SOS response-associated peptidase YedK